jgi:hypothetical protein
VVKGALFALTAYVGACTGADAAGDGVDAAAPTDGAADDGAFACRPGIALRVSAKVAELRSQTPFPIEILVRDSGAATAAHPVKVVLARQDGTPLKTLLDASQPPGTQTLSFTPSAEPDLPAGALQLNAEVGCPQAAPGAPARASETVYLLRLGATKIAIKGGEGGGRVPLLYHALAHRESNYFPIPESLPVTSLDIPSGEPELDEKDGSPRRFPAEPWADLDSPPVDGRGAVRETGYTLPVSLVVGTRPDLSFTIGKTARSASGSQPTGLSEKGRPPVFLILDGAAGSDAGLVEEAGEITLRLPASPVPAINRIDKTIRWRFAWKDEGGEYVAIPGSEQSATLRFYGVLGNEQGKAAPDLPWVAVVDDATTAIAGRAADAERARAILVQHIYEDLGLSYDRKGGASYYTRYSGGFASASFSLSQFLTRARGKIVNCSDCASILSTYANMIGAKLHYAIIGPRFDLNPILGIGAMSFGSPFDSGRMQFSYHAVTTPDMTMTIDDATLAVDGDDDPKTAPHKKLLVQSLSGSDYLTRLSPTYGTGTPGFQYDDQVTHVR